MIQGKISSGRSAPTWIQNSRGRKFFWAEPTRVKNSSKPGNPGTGQKICFGLKKVFGLKKCLGSACLFLEGGIFQRIFPFGFLGNRTQIPWISKLRIGISKTDLKIISARLKTAVKKCLYHYFSSINFFRSVLFWRRLNREQKLGGVKKLGDKKNCDALYKLLIRVWKLAL